MDPCFYKRHDALIIVHVDDMRVSALPDVLLQLHTALFHRFKITTSDGSRFLGMDVTYDRPQGLLKMSMQTYIQSTMDRFLAFDTTLGCPYREIVGCLLWIVLCVVGPELVRVKDLARRSNHTTPLDYQAALKVLKRLWKRRDVAIIFLRGSAGNEWVPSQIRPSVPVPALLASALFPSDASEPFPTDDGITDIPEVAVPVNMRFRQVGFTDAAFAVGEAKESFSGFVIYLNGTPILWGSLCQTSPPDSTCAAEFVAASVCCKYMVQIENAIRFLGFRCPTPYRLYTDSQASLSIASNAHRMGKIWHIQIRYHLVRAMVTAGNVDFVFCVTEDKMIADLLTKC
jgi:hypothetical protein